MWLFQWHYKILNIIDKQLKMEDLRHEDVSYDGNSKEKVDQSQTVENGDKAVWKEGNTRNEDRTISNESWLVNIWNLVVTYLLQIMELYE